ncbi:hypothetical protein [Vibrio sp. Hep-1b-8]|uniref:hypothetical protein n=1 Tax=Vibrio sp. Hep-1b-8 TaxID=2144187 RepID=UPI001F0E76BC|nr:hypothetical protein [Vibrio sp. Hep-1b-8]
MITGILAVYVIIWSVPAVIMSAMVSLGSIERIVFIDKQLAKNLDKYYDDQGYMKWNYQMSYSIGTRLFGYWLAYPFIRHRVTTKSKKFRLFMWVNCIGIWSFFITPCFTLLVEWLETIG